MNVFAYGSLLNPVSARAAMKNYKQGRLLSVSGWIRCWNVYENVFSSEMGAVVPAAFLNIMRAHGSVTGVVYDVSSEDMERLIVRERKYNLELLGSFDGFGEVFSFIGRAEEKKGYVLDEYKSKVIQGIVFNKIDRMSGDLGDCRGLIPLGGDYRFLDEAQNGLV